MSRFTLVGCFSIFHNKCLSMLSVSVACARHNALGWAQSLKMTDFKNRALCNFVEDKWYDIYKIAQDTLGVNSEHRAIFVFQPA